MTGTTAAILGYVIIALLLWGYAGWLCVQLWLNSRAPGDGPGNPPAPLGPQAGASQPH